jgi:hypothetical protein
VLASARPGPGRVGSTGIGHRRLNTLAGSLFAFHHPDGQTLGLDLCDGWGRSTIC